MGLVMLFAGLSALNRGKVTNTHRDRSITL
jgi:hypothetical protein